MIILGLIDESKRFTTFFAQIILFDNPVYYMV